VIKVYYLGSLRGVKTFEYEKEFIKDYGRSGIMTS
jgi:hypothetical protein